MREFQDTAGRTWTLDVTVGSIKRVREATNVILPALFDDNMKPVAELTKDYEKLVNVLWAMCSKQRPDVDAEQFAESLGGDTLGKATEALVRATADFFTSPEQRAALHKMIDTILETAGKLTNLAGNRVAEILATVDTSQLAASCLDFVTSGQDKPALTQTREPLASCM